MEISEGTRIFSWDGLGGKVPRRCYSSRTRTAGARRKLRWDGSGFACSPLVQWKFSGDMAGAPATEGGMIRLLRGRTVIGVSARKLAAGLWHLPAALNSGGGSGGGGSGVGGGGMTWYWQHGRFDRLQVGIHSPLTIPKSVMEGATKWNRGYSNTPSPSEAVRQLHSHVRLSKNQQVATISAASALQVELVRARNRVKELETERCLYKKKLKHFLRRIHEEKASWMRREYRKMFLMVDDLKGELERERRNYQKVDIVNSKLLSDLADAKLSAKQLVQDYEKEKNVRELLEDVCHELGKDIEGYKAKIKAMKMECARIQEDVEEERNMMQMAEVWREERVQMKLVDAKLILEERYFQMNNVIADLETLLRTNPDVIKMTEAKGVSLVMDSFSTQDIKELCYTPPTADDIYTIIENLQGRGTGKIERGIDEYESHISCSHCSEFHNVIPEANELTKNLVYVHSNHSSDHDKSSGNASFRENVTCIEDQYSSYDIGDIACSVDGISGRKYISSATGFNDQNGNQESLTSKTNKISSEQKLRNKRLSHRKLWRSTPSDADVLKTISIEGSPEKVSQAALNHHDLADHWCLPGQRNPHVARAMRGRIEWPRGIQRNGLKANLLEASLESQKAQLRNVLKQRIK